ncbi:twin-arginine translocase subunit TatC [Metallosphaera tengchongensis]|uniref:Sec-independent protein translocase protein TatC n=1 Tax=Metallosphaera tengchongensis TaxID=1532350 RepID=A0A6N0NWJ6_9CREN|nr:twin-arginine translocase subunit TatC [Metallosphaera tengchongensis]QKR00575.1 twin-arginine translocase subunit TatC [Metallosphaera tengchongensis]
MTEKTSELQKSGERPLLEHLNELIYRARRALISLVSAFVIFFFFGIKEVSFNGFNFPILYPNLFNSISSYFIRLFIHTELPPQLKLLNLNPFDTLFSAAYVSFFLSLFIAMPIIIHEIWGFVSPGLYENEKKMAKSLILPAFVLFAAGSSFAYFIIIPVMMKFVLLYTTSLGVEPTLSLRAFINTVMSLMLTVGLGFEYPLIMTMLTMAGVVKAESWRRNWRYGVLGAFIIAWFISPGTTGGVIETTIGVTLSTLYFVGVASSYLAQKRRK